MTDQEIKEALAQSLQDHLLSRTEKQLLNETLRKIKTDRHKLNVFRAYVFDIARAEIESAEGKQITQWIEGVMKLLNPPQTVPKIQSRAFFSSQDSCANVIISVIKKMQKNIDICVFTVTDDRISNALIDAHQRGVKVRLITDDDKAGDRGSDAARLSKAGIKVRTDAARSHMHHKYAIFDGAHLLTGSYNWTRSADRDNKENFIITNDQELLTSFIVHFEETWDNFENI